MFEHYEKIELESFFDDPDNVRAILATIVRVKETFRNRNIVFHPKLANFSFALRNKYEKFRKDGRYSWIDNAGDSSYSLNKNSPVLPVIENQLLQILDSYGDQRESMLYGWDTTGLVQTYFAPFTLDQESLDLVVSNVDAWLENHK